MLARLPEGRDLHSVDFDALDAFAVGEAGSILHLVVEGTAIPVWTPL